MVLSPAGVFSGTPAAVDVGSYAITILATDGSLVTEATLLLDIAEAPSIPVNARPVFIAGSVFDQNSLVGFPITPVAPQFNDPNGDTLRYSMAGTIALPIGIRLNATTGVISGTPLLAVQANNLRVRATDPSGASAVSTLFYIRVR